MDDNNKKDDEKGVFLSSSYKTRVSDFDTSGLNQHAVMLLEKHTREEQTPVPQELQAQTPQRNARDQAEDDEISNLDLDLDLDLKPEVAVAKLLEVYPEAQRFYPLCVTLTTRAFIRELDPARKQDLGTFISFLNDLRDSGLSNEKRNIFCYQYLVDERLAINGLPNPQTISEGTKVVDADLTRWFAGETE